MPFNHLFVLLKVFLPSNKKQNFIFNNKIKWRKISWGYNITLENILDHLDSLEDDPFYWLGISYYLDITVDDILNHPELPWDWGGLSANSNLSLNDILKHRKLPWDWDILSFHYDITMDVILNNLDIPWSIRYLSAHSGITIRDIFDHPEIFLEESGKDGISRNSNLTLDDILKYTFPTEDTGNPDEIVEKLLEWDWEGISNNANITIEDLLKYPNFPWYWDDVFYNDNIDIDDPINYPNLPSSSGNTQARPGLNLAKFKKDSQQSWNWKDISGQPVFPIKMLSEYLDLAPVKDNNLMTPPDNILAVLNTLSEWDWDGISSNLEITMEIITKLSNTKVNPRWNWRKISGAIPLGDIFNNLTKSTGNLDNYYHSNGYKTLNIIPEWDWEIISARPDITLDIILRHLNTPSLISWDWGKLIKNPGISTDDILKHPELPWVWGEISSNPNLTARFILDHPNILWDWRLISYNKFDRYNAAVKIQRCWRKKAHFFRWKRRIEDTNLAILYNPKIKGLEFLKEQELVEMEYNG